MPDVVCSRRATRNAGGRGRYGRRRFGVAQEPRQVEWRLQLARLLVRQGDYRKALHELQSVLALKPDLAAARDLHQQVIALERARVRRGGSPGG